MKVLHHNVWKSLCLLLVFSLRAVQGHGTFRMSLDVEVKSYSGRYAYVVLQEFIGYTNSTSLALPVEGYVYTVENSSAPKPPPFLPNSTWIAFVPNSVGHMSKFLVDAISSSGYSILLVDGSLSIDGDATTEIGNVSLVIIDNATYFFAALPTSSTSIKVSLSIGIIWIDYLPPRESFFSLTPLMISMTIFGLSCGCCVCAYVRYRMKVVRRHLTVGQYELRTLEVHPPSHHQTLSALEAERNSRKTAAEILDTLQLVAESGKAEFGVCSVCLANVGSPKECKALPCHHYFHPACIDEWLVEHNFTCPVCRQDPRITLADLFV